MCSNLTNSSRRVRLDPSRGLPDPLLATLGPREAHGGRPPHGALGPHVGPRNVRYGTVRYDRCGMAVPIRSALDDTPRDLKCEVSGLSDAALQECKRSAAYACKDNLAIQYSHDGC